MELSVCMILKNEESCLKRCLDSVKDLADEIIVVDTGSSDKTKEIAEEFTDKVYDFTWVDDFSKARNFSLSKATKDWILIMDADEVLDEENKKRIRQAIKTDTDAVLLIQREYWKEENKLGFTPLDKKTSFTQGYNGYTSTPVIRLFRRDKKIFFEDRVHETVGRSIAKAGLKVTRREDIFIHHYKEEKGEDGFRQRQLNYLKILKEVVKDDPKNARAHYKIAGIYDAVLHEYSSCIEHLEKAYENGYDEQNCLIGIGLCQLYLNREKEAEDTFIKLMGKGYDDPIISYHLYKIYYKRKDNRRLKIILDHLAKLDSPYKKEALKVLESLNAM